MIKNNYFKDKILWFIFGIFLIITFWGLINHVPWRDEAQSWLIVRDLNFAGVINQMPYEGTPPLWHLLIYPLAKIGLPFTSELILHYLLALAFIFIFLFFSPLPKRIKIILPFSYYFLFEYTLVARNYNLTALLLFTIASIYNHRFQRPLLYGSLVFLLAWTNIHSLAISLLLFFLFLFEVLKERRGEIKNIIAVVLMQLGIVSAVLMLTPQIDQYSGLNLNDWHVIARSLSSALLPFLENPLIPIYLIYLVSLIWIPILIFILKNYQSKILFLLSYFWLAFIFLFKHPGGTRHYGLILIFFLFAWWIDIIKNKKGIINKPSLSYKITLHLLTACLVINLVYGFYFYIDGFHKNFSGAQEMAQYIKKNNLNKQEIAAYPSYSGSALLPYFPGKNFYQLETQKKGTFLTWNNAFFIGANTPYPVLKRYLKYYYSLPENKTSSILFLTTLPEGSDPELELIFKNTKETIKPDEFFYLYRLRLE